MTILEYTFTKGIKRQVGESKILNAGATRVLDEGDMYVERRDKLTGEVTTTKVEFTESFEVLDGDHIRRNIWKGTELVVDEFATHAINKMGFSSEQGFATTKEYKWIPG